MEELRFPMMPPLVPHCQPRRRVLPSFQGSLLCFKRRSYYNIGGSLLSFKRRSYYNTGGQVTHITISLSNSSYPSSYTGGFVTRYTYTLTVVIPTSPSLMCTLRVIFDELYQVVQKLFDILLNYKTIGDVVCRRGRVWHNPLHFDISLIFYIMGSRYIIHTFIIDRPNRLPYSISRLVGHLPVENANENISTHYDKITELRVYVRPRIFQGVLVVNTSYSIGICMLNRCIIHRIYRPILYARDNFQAHKTWNRYGGRSVDYNTNVSQDGLLSNAFQQYTDCDEKWRASFFHSQLEGG